MAEKTSGLSLEFIVHPGETLKEILDERGMSQKELGAKNRCYRITYEQCNQW